MYVTFNLLVTVRVWVLDFVVCEEKAYLNSGFLFAFRIIPALYVVCVVFTFSLNFDSFVRLKVYPSCVKQSSHLHKHKSTHLLQMKNREKKNFVSNSTAFRNKRDVCIR